MKKIRFLLLGFSIFACSSQSETSKQELKQDNTSELSIQITQQQLTGFEALPTRMVAPNDPSSPDTLKKRIALGKKLFFETKLSKDNTVSCNSCHHLNEYGVDGTAVSTGIQKQQGKRNAPTVYNAAGHFAQFWDGRAATVEEQAKGPILNPIEMGSTEKNVVAMLKKDATYATAFREAFPDDLDAVTYQHVGDAIGSFERNLVTPSKWDAFLKGNTQALSNIEKKGFQVFMATGCAACHSGMYIGGTMYQKLGAVVAWPHTADLGRYEVTHQDADKMVFKVPALRNVEKTAPYFHDGSVPTLEEAVRLMAKHQLGKDLSQEDTQAIVAWLKTLTGTLPDIAAF